MSKFLKTIAETYSQLNIEEDTIGYGTTSIIDKIKKAIETGSQAAGGADVQNIITDLFGLDKIKDNTPLQNAVEKIKTNPANPNLDQNELEALASVVQDEKTGKFKTTNAPSQNPPPQQKPVETPTTTQTSYNYNPMTNK
jgi:hypothetical protein